MVSDVLAELVDRLDHYLQAPEYQLVYRGEVRAAIHLLRHLADDLRATLDSGVRPGPHGELPPDTFAALCVRRVLDGINHPLRQGEGL